MLRILFWRALALVALAFGLVGAVLPVLPTVPFLIVAAWAASRGWPQLEAWLLNHERFGPALRGWRERGTVPRRAKWLASALMSMSVIAVLYSPVPVWVKIGVPVFLCGLALWLWLRPEP
ncbi:MAG TPA: YbaN family protein [Burkholderiales bacterium]|nr:YbaN family protein [Burkholderiales bacterium]